MGSEYCPEALATTPLDRKAGSSLTLYRHQCGLQATVAYFAPFMYSLLVCAVSCCLSYMGMKGHCISDVCFSTVRAYADVAGCLPNYAFIVSHSCLMLIVWASGVSGLRLGLLSASAALISISFFYSELPHVLLIACGLGFLIIAFIWIAILAKRQKRFFLIILGVAVCCIGMLIVIAIGPYKGRRAYYKRPIFSVFEYSVILIIGIGYYFICAEDGQHHTPGFKTKKWLP